MFAWTLLGSRREGAPFDTPHGKVAFLLIVGVEGAVREKVLALGSDLVTRV